MSEHSAELAETVLAFCDAADVAAGAQGTTHAFVSTEQVRDVVRRSAVPVTERAAVRSARFGPTAVGTGKCGRAEGCTLPPHLERDPCAVPTNADDCHCAPCAPCEKHEVSP